MVKIKNAKGKGFSLRPLSAAFMSGVLLSGLPANTADLDFSKVPLNTPGL